jgi:flagellar hook assembly protein FlgD
VKNESGQVVDEFPVNLPASGEAFFAWDGENAQDQQLPAGDYKLEIIGTREDGTRVEGAALVGSRVTGVDFLDSETALLTTNGRISASDVRRVNNPA